MLAIVTLVELRITDVDAVAAANAAYDRSLLGAVKSIDSNISTQSGGLSVELPYRMFEFFELTASGQVYFRVATSDGLVELGSADLPEPPDKLNPGTPVFYDATYFREPVRVAAYLRELDRPVAQSAAKYVMIQVAESTQSRQEFTRSFVVRAAARDAVILALTMLCATAAVSLAVRPLARLGKEVAARKGSDLTPLEDTDLPADVRPLVQAVNHHMARTRELVTQQRSFLDDASHQLRTHLTTLQMQMDYALREQDQQGVRSAVEAAREELARATRSTQQLLTLARSDTVQLRVGDLDLRELVQEVAVDLLPQARARQIDLGVEAASQPATADRSLMREALANLVANAIVYVPERGRVTVSAAADQLGWSLNVEDNGPGLSEEERQTLGVRFRRGVNSTKSGSGLGLAIARSIAQRHGGVLRLEPRAAGRGLSASIWWPRGFAATAPTFAEAPR
ncbi:sensor histidine kinase [Ramlibacter paludis]|uniref:sensor histidine kinase n=1 Tax=Ramlibacter paludis TaxID=2908000 RepID=UPI003211BDEF